MPKVMFTISYTVKPARRQEYLELIGKMKAHLANVGSPSYSVFEAKNKQNQFTEVFLTNSMEEFDALDDQDEATEAMVNQIEEYIDEGSKKYSTLVEA